MADLLRDPKKFKESLDRDLSDAWRLMAEVEGWYLSAPASAWTDDANAAFHAFAQPLQRAYVKLTMGLEALGFTAPLSDLRDRFRELHASGLGRLVCTGPAEYSSPVLDLLLSYSNALDAAMGAADLPGLQHRRELLRRILEMTPMIVRQRAVQPSKEKEVRDVVFEHLKIIFPDVRRDPHIIKPTKTYKPDFGIRELKAAIEYKFATTEDEARKILGGIYEDIHGYAGSEDWTDFYAVLYLADHFLSRHQVDAEWSMSEPSKRWHPILVVGGGQPRHTGNSKKARLTARKPLGTDGE